MGQKKRQGDPWMPGYRYGALLPPFSLNLIVAEVERAVNFYRNVLAATVHYYDVDFAAMQVGGAALMLHADHTHDHRALYNRLTDGAPRGLGAQFRLLGIDPDEVEKHARDSGAILIAGALDKAHGWREVIVQDPDGYEWAVGVLIPPAKGPFGPTGKTDGEGGKREIG